MTPRLAEAIRSRAQMTMVKDCSCSLHMLEDPAKEPRQHAHISGRNVHVAKGLARRYKT